MMDKVGKGWAWVKAHVECALVPSSDARAVVVACASARVLAAPLFGVARLLRVLGCASLAIACERGAINLSALISSMVLIFIGFMFILKFTPTMESEASSSNITDTTTSAFADMVPWMAPTLALVALILGAVGLIMSRGRRGR